MFIRFAINKLDEDSNKRQGIFVALGELSDRGELLEYEEEIYKNIKSWFIKNLNVPTSLSKSKKPNAKFTTISWYKDTATEHISRMYELVSLLEAHDIHVNVMRTEKPGYVVYEDDHQVSAKPTNDTET